MRKKKLLVLSTTFPRWTDDDEPRFVFDLSRRLKDAFDIVVLAPHAPGSATRETLDGIEVVRFRYAPESLERLAYGGGIGTNLRAAKWKYLLVNGFLLAFFFNALDIVRRHRVDAVHAHWLIPGGMIAAALKVLYPRLRCIATAHGADVFQLRGPWFARARRWVAGEIDALAVVGDSLAARAESEGWSDNRLHVAPMGVDLQHTFVPQPRADGPQTIMFAGRLVAKKGVDVLVRAFALVTAQAPDCRLVISGDGPERAALENLATTLGVADMTSFTGRYRHAELPSLFARADAVALPFVEAGDGDAEGLGLTAIEALGCERPLVASLVPSLSGILEHGKTAYLVEPGSPEALAETLLGVLDSPEQARACAVAGRDSVLAAFDWPVVVERYRQLLNPGDPA